MDPIRFYGLTEVQDAIEIQVVVASLTHDGGYGIVDHERVLFGSGSSDGNRMPPVVVETVAGIVSNSNRSVAQVDDVMNVTVDQFNGDEVLTLSGVVQYDALGLQRLKLEVNVGGRVGFELRQADVSVLGFEIDWMVDALLFSAELGRYVGAA